MRLVDLITSVKVVYLIHILLVTVAAPSFHPEVAKLPSRLGRKTVGAQQGGDALE